MAGAARASSAAVAGSGTVAWTVRAGRKASLAFSELPYDAAADVPAVPVVIRMPALLEGLSIQNWISDCGTVMVTALPKAAL